MSRKFGGRLIRIMMTKSSSCDITKKKKTIRRGSGSRPKGPYLMDLRFWNYVIPDGSTTGRLSPSARAGFGTMSFQMVPLLIVIAPQCCCEFWNYVIPDGSTTIVVFYSRPGLFWNYVIPDGSTTLPAEQSACRVFWNYVIPDGSTTMTKELCKLFLFWNYVIPDGSTTVFWRM